jgi:hypothetical protein
VPCWMVLDDVVTQTFVNLSVPSLGISAACTAKGNTDAAASVTNLRDIIQLPSYYGSRSEDCSSVSAEGTPTGIVSAWPTDHRIDLYQPNRPVNPSAIGPAREGRPDRAIESRRSDADGRRLSRSDAARELGLKE